MISIIQRQKSLLREAGFKPTWERFANSTAWFHMSRELSENIQQRYKELWETLP
jgi:hypothetical protein